MEKKKSFKAEKDPDKLRKVKKETSKKVVKHNVYAENEDFLDIDIDDGLKNHGFQSFDEEDD